MTEKIYEKIASEIESLISSKILKPGDKIPAERKLAKDFNVSRNTIREAVKILAEKQAVFTKTGSGTFVSQNAAQTISKALEDSFGKRKKRLNEIIELRQIIEPGTAALAAEKITQKQIEKLVEIIQEQEKNSGSKLTFGKLDELFHKTIAKASSNSVILSLYDKFTDIISETRVENLISSERIKNSIILHKKLLDAIKNKDSKKAFELMEEHMKEIKESLKI
ncbi:MAG: FadR/GntR family transcriptional regulator [Desulforegulaceae bacterium]|nr:FadR/GntR family transcriptional regulator [Desulforegulaceae bacterium]